MTEATLSATLAVAEAEVERFRRLGLACHARTQVAEMRCATRRDDMSDSPRSYAQLAEIICATRRDDMCNSPR